MQVNVQQGCPGFVDTGPERLLDIREIVQTLRVIEIDNQMRTSAADPLSFDEVVQAIFRIQCSDRIRIYVFLLGGASWLGSVHDAFFNLSLQVHPQLEEGDVFHYALPNQQMRPDQNRSRVHTNFRQGIQWVFL